MSVRKQSKTTCLPQTQNLISWKPRGEIILGQQNETFEERQKANLS